MPPTLRSPDAAVLEAAAALAQSIQGNPKWCEWLDAQKAADTDARFTQMVTRKNELARIQNSAQSGAQGLDGKSLVEFITLRDQLGRHELHLRQQQAGRGVVELLRLVNERISEELGLDFASNASPPRGGCCG